MPESHKSDSGDGLDEVVLTLCQRCINGEGGECHTPGCSLWMNRAPDVPVTLYEVVQGRRNV